jgi:hypothetical protein
MCQSNKSTLVPKQHHQTLGERCSPPGPVPDVAAPQHTRDKDNSSKRLLKDRPTHAALQFPNQFLEHLPVAYLQITNLTQY